MSRDPTMQMDNLATKLELQANYVRIMKQQDQNKMK